MSRMTSRGVKCSPAVSFERLGEAPHELLVEVAHLDVRHSVGVEVDLGEAGEHQVEQVGTGQAGDLGVEVELVEDFPGPGAEPGDVGPQGGVVEEAREVERGGVVEALPGHRAEHGLYVVDLAPELRRSGEDGLLGRLQHAVEAAKDGQREDDLAVLGLLVVAPEQIGDGPDERGVVVDPGLDHADVSPPCAVTWDVAPSRLPAAGIGHLDQSWPAGPLRLRWPGRAALGARRRGPLEAGTGDADGQVTRAGTRAPTKLPCAAA